MRVQFRLPGLQCRMPDGVSPPEQLGVRQLRVAERDTGVELFPAWRGQENQLTQLRGEIQARLRGGNVERMTRIHLEDALVRIEETLGAR